MGTSAEAKSILPAGIDDVRTMPLSRLAQENRGSGARFCALLGYNTERVAVAAFQSSI